MPLGVAYLMNTTPFRAVNPMLDEGMEYSLERFSVNRVISQICSYGQACPQYNQTIAYIL